MYWKINDEDPNLPSKENVAVTQHSANNYEVPLNLQIFFW